MERLFVPRLVVAEFAVAQQLNALHDGACKATPGIGKGDTRQLAVGILERDECHRIALLGPDGADLSNQADNLDGPRLLSDRRIAHGPGGRDQGEMILEPVVQIRHRMHAAQRHAQQFLLDTQVLNHLRRRRFRLGQNHGRRPDRLLIVSKQAVLPLHAGTVGYFRPRHHGVHGIH